jgi:uncharacterized membrane protein YgcG
MMRMRPALTVLLGLLVCGPAGAVFPPAMKDDGKFFKAAVVEKANQKIREIYEKYKKDVVIETLANLSAEQIKAAKDEGTKKFFDKYAFERAKALGLNGIYVVICKEPRYARVHMDPGTQKSAFTAANRDEAFQKLVSKFKEEEFDAGLQAMIEYIEATLKKNIK